MSDSSEIITSVQKLSLKTLLFFFKKRFHFMWLLKKIPWQAKFKPLVMRVFLCFQVIGRKQVSALSSYEIILKYKSRTNVVFKCTLKFHLAEWSIQIVSLGSLLDAFYLHCLGFQFMLCITKCFIQEHFLMPSH